MQRIDWTKWSAVAEIVSSVAIVATLVYPTVQTQQNTEAVRANSSHTVLSTDLQLLDHLILEPGIWISMTKPKLTPEESVTLDEETWKTYLTGLTNTFSYPRTRAFWKPQSVGVFDPGFSRSVDEYLAGVPALPGVYISGFGDQQ